MSKAVNKTALKPEDMENNSNENIQEVVDVQDNDVANESEDFLQGRSVDEYFKEVMNIIKLCQKYSSDLQGWQNYADYSGVLRTMTGVNKQLSNLIGKIFIHQDIKLNINGYKLSDQFDIIREGNDALCERINADLDTASGIKRQINLDICDTTVRTIRGPVNRATGRDVVLFASRNVQKPQLFFNPKIDNSAKEPFIPVLKEKPNSLKPLSTLLCIDAEGKEFYSHPYEYELQHWNPPSELLQPNKPIKPLSMSEIPLVWVDTEESLLNMIAELKTTKAIAVDVEHHNFRTYQGLTCLIQISTRKQDYIVDPFPTRNLLPSLNEVFTDPKIAKVFHGGNQDILWLQRDCGVYVVNMFDTHQASLVLEYPHKSLSYLLSKFCSVEPDKSYQRSDWRIRPLPENFMYYARQDTHYLLYIYDCMKNELIEKGNTLNNLLCAVFSRSTELCLLRYEKPILGPDSHMDLYRRSKKIFNVRQLTALHQIYQWRDRLARLHDESINYVLPKHMMLQMAEVLPKEMQGILACCNPIPTFVKMEQLTLHQIIRATREIPLDKMNEENESISLNHMFDSVDPMSYLECRFDLSLEEEHSTGLSTLLNPQQTLLGDLFDQSAQVESKTDSTLLGSSEIIKGSWRNRLSHKTEHFMCPFERYQISIEQLRIEEEKEKEEKEKRLKEIEESDKVRVNKIKDLFKSLSSGIKVDSPSSPEDIPDTKQGSSTPIPEASEMPSSDDARLERLRMHIASLMMPTVGEDTYDSTEESVSVPTRERKVKKKDKLKKKLSSEQKSTKNHKKRQSLENGEKSSKKLKVKNEEKGDSSKEKMEGDCSKEKMEEGELEEGEIQEDEIQEEGEMLEEGEIQEVEIEGEGEMPEEGEIQEEKIQPFDYENADYSIFKPKNTKRFKGRYVKEKFKKLGRNKSTGFRKGSAKSMSWH